MTNPPFDEVSMIGGKTSFPEFKTLFEGKNILVTGGTGTIGYELVKALLRLGPKVLRVFSRDEQKQFYMREEFRALDNVRLLIGDVRDRPRLTRAMENIDIVFHLAALKHVESCEYNPFEAIKTNVNGTQNVIDAALESDVETVVFTSTDKAVNPSNAMGASKLMAEKLMVAGQQSKGARRTNFCSVRFGNVLGSSGSVIPTFVDRIRRGLSIEITHPEMTRFIIGFSDCIELMLTACRDLQGGEVFIRKMPIVRIVDLAEALIEELAGLYNLNKVDVKEIGIRAGEKLFEELVTEEESARTVDIGDYLVILPQIGLEQQRFNAGRKITIGSYTSRSYPPISIEGIKAVLRAHKTLSDPNLLAGIRIGKPEDAEPSGNRGFMESFNAG